MKRYVCILVGLATVFLFGPDFVSAEGPSVRWQKTFGGTENEYGYSVQQTIDGGYIIAGLTTSFGSGSCDVYLVKTDPNGDVVWEKTFGGHDCEKGRSVQQTLDGGYIIAGQDYVGGVYDDAYLIKTDPNGDMVWEKTYGGDMEEWIYSVQQTTDGGYVIAGETHSYGAGAWDVYVIKTDPNGESEWQKTFGGSIVDSGWCVRQTLDGGYIIVGRAYSFGAGSSDVYLIKTDPNGDSQWEKTFGGIYEDSGYSVQQTSDGGYIVTGSAYTPDLVSKDVYLVKTDPNGNSQWEKYFGGDGFDGGYSVHQTTDGGYIIAGYTNSFGAGTSDVYIIKTDPNGNSQWQKTLGADASDIGRSIQQTIDGGYIISGHTYSYGTGGQDIYLIKLCSEATLPGDLNCDGKVDFKDMAIFVNQWLLPRSISLPPADIAEPGDGTAHFFDFSVLANDWGDWRVLLDKATSPNPPDGAISVGITADLSWTASQGATSHDVYFGTNNPPPFILNKETTTYDPGTMAYNTKYYWRIDEVGNYGTIRGMDWSFTTIMSPPPP